MGIFQRWRFLFTDWMFVGCGQIRLFQTRRKNKMLRKLWKDEAGQDIAEYAVMLAVILVIVVGTIRLIGSNAQNVFSQVASSISPTQ